ncbi:bifunctional adenosylcobinamide kinase/adenosylcobinamide-phosphate guanylyltransferase [Amylibacter kogurei]|uniref:Bifunctional adenosylcobalamin biosynthesis protein n=1 Tax=Paramylibacter kogurei TaxID=1889778 RepID=A0A2G5K4J9_9RHOB|nr:bifunctional adenosylcobinamide kinase/adenosylcobinamide-phosphate guanylyltransferase [Amylibacter kogurei]PIB23952.1 bifunctional adenosylcobinamide kinase/adenosylcobinamide-phosphate guanylyltransferase [Amylibacter kogurei]
MTSPDFPKLSLIIGGAASGKSRFGESLARFSEKSKLYIATAQAFDDEMHEKIAKHRIDRGTDWVTIESPFELAQHIMNASAGSVVFVDCLTLWLSNHLMVENALDGLASDLLKAITQTQAPVILISNEVGQSVVPENAMARQFQNAQGRLNQDIAKRADLVVHVIAGIPTAIKGQMPTGIL